MNNVKRFTLRKEYFGGLIHDARLMFCHVFGDATYKTLEAMEREAGSFCFSDCAGQELQKLKQVGVLEGKFEGKLYLSNDLRAITPPAIIPYECLTAPIRVYHTFTRRCNLNCPQCCVSSNADFTEAKMTIEQFENVIQKFYDAGTMEWRFTGGEATFCPDFLEAVRITKLYGMAVMLNSNGCWSPELTEKILQAGISEIIISVEGEEETNDRRRSRGVYQNSLRVFERIHRHNEENPEKNIRITINMTVAKDNVQEVESVVRLGARYGYNVNFVPLRPYGRTPAQLPKTILSSEEFMRFSENVQRLRTLAEIKDSGIRIVHRNMDLFCPDYPDKSDQPYPFNYSDCGALSTGFGLCPDGRVNACSFLMSDPESIGPNMTEVSVQDAWLHPKMEHFRRAKKVGCSGCRFYKKQCEGKCRAMVLSEGGKIEDGKLFGKDHYCFAALMPR